VIYSVDLRSVHSIVCGNRRDFARHFWYAFFDDSEVQLKWKVQLNRCKYSP